MDEYYCLTVLAQPNETTAEFNKRLIAFWSDMLRRREADYEGVYAEATAFHPHEGRTSRQYFIAIEAIEVLCAELQAAAFEFVPFDRTDTYSRYEAVSPDWFQLDH